MSSTPDTGTPARVDAERVREIARAHGFDAAGIAALGPSDHAEFYRAWIERGLHGEMHYLARPDAVEARLHPATRFADVRCALVVALHYDPAPDGSESSPDRGVIARYARGRDYHRVMKKKLLAVLGDIEREIGHALPAARAYVDTGPVLERELARRAGLGWFGRNTMLIHPRRGSYFFLGSLLLELDLEPDEAFAREHCGSCHACIDACPTGALLGKDEHGAPVMDARLCISYLTIENRGPIPVELRPLIGNRVFGCDICQEVCPWNGQTSRDEGYGEGYGEEVAGRSRARRGAALPVIADFRVEGWEAPSLVSLMRMTYDEWDVWTRGKALRRAGYAGFRRNVAVALGNWLSSVHEPPEDAVAVLRAALEDESDLVREHAAWALREIASSGAFAARESRAVAEGDPHVRAELEAALARSRPRAK